MPKIAYIQPLFHVPEKIDHVAAEQKHKDHLRAAAEDVTEKSGFVDTKISFTRIPEQAEFWEWI